MPGWRSRPQSPATDTALSSVSEERILKLVIRALRNGYGAESALRNAVRSGASEMRTAGARREMIRNAVANCVVHHPSALPDKASLVTGQSRASSLLARMLGWSDDMASAKPSRVAP